jgi:hypothetical protein
MNRAWPLNRNHEAARRHIDDVLSRWGRWPGSRRETQIAELLDQLETEVHELRAKVYGPGRRDVLA